MLPEDYMRRALELAKKGEGHTSPNPMVGCVIVKDGRIISEGYHERYGEYHAERNALLRCKEDAHGADLYVTLEPCCHYGKTPPCTDIIIERGIGHVFVGSMDVNPLVAGKGVQILQDHGIEVTTGILEKECLKLNEVFYHYMTEKTPFVASKFAMSADGKIACVTGDSRWVTGEESRRQTHVLRKRYSAIMCGIGTVLADDPMLNCRIEEGVDPTRIICDSKLSIPLECNIVKTAKEIPTIVACSASAIRSKEAMYRIAYLQDHCIEVIATGKPDDGVQEVDLKELMADLGKRQIDSILLEGGGTLNGAAYEAGIVNKVYAFIAPKIIGGKGALSPVGGRGAQSMKEAVLLSDVSYERYGDDICLIGYPKGQGTKG